MDVKAGATQIVQKLVRHGYVAYFAGGWVRDYLMGHPYSSDIDIATDAPPEKILDLFPHTLVVGLAFGIVVVLIEGRPYEVATFRKDLEYSNGRSPNGIELTGPEEDAKRRDFTINGMFYDPLTDKIHDYVHGYEDLKKGIIRTIGDPQERFFEDRLRMIRAIRFSTRFGFPIEQETQDAIIENADTLFPPVAIERVYQELKKMADYPNFEHAMIELHRLGLLPIIFPQLAHVHLNDIKHRVAHFPKIPHDTPLVYFLMDLFPHMTLPEMTAVFLYLKCSQKDVKQVEFAFRSRTLSDNDVEWVHYYANPLAEAYLNYAAAHQENGEAFLNTHRERKKRLSNHVERAKSKQLLVTSDQLKQNGIKPGILMGKLLKEGEEIAITKDLNTPEPIIEQLRQSTNWKPE